MELSCFYILNSSETLLIVMHIRLSYHVLFFSLNCLLCSLYIQNIRSFEEDSDLIIHLVVFVGINAPTSQSFLNYVLLAIVYGAIMLYRRKPLKVVFCTSI